MKKALLTAVTLFAAMAVFSCAETEDDSSPKKKSTSSVITTDETEEASTDSSAKGEKLTDAYSSKPKTDDTDDIFADFYTMRYGFAASDSILKVQRLGNDDLCNSYNIYLSSLLGKCELTEDHEFLPELYYEPIGYEISFDETQVSKSEDINMGDGSFDCYSAMANAMDPFIELIIDKEQLGGRDVAFYVRSCRYKRFNIWAFMSEGDEVRPEQVGGRIYFPITEDETAIVKTNVPTRIIDGSKLEKLRLAILSENGVYTGVNEYIMLLPEQKLYAVNKERISEDFGELVKNRAEVDLDNSTDIHIECTVTIGEGQIFVTDIPYDEKWHITSDGEELPCITTLLNEDSGTYQNDRDAEEGIISVVSSRLGAKLPVGEHKLVLEYKNKK